MATVAGARCAVCGGELRGPPVPASRATWGRCPSCGAACHARCVEEHDRSRHPEMVVDQVALDSVPPPDPIDEAAELDRRSLVVMRALMGVTLFSGGHVKSFGILGNGMLFLVGALSLFLYPTWIGIAVMAVAGAGLAVNFIFLRRRLRAAALRTRTSRP